MSMPPLSQQDFDALCFVYSRAKEETMVSQPFDFPLLEATKRVGEYLNLLREHNPHLETPQ